MQKKSIYKVVVLGLILVSIILYIYIPRFTYWHMYDVNLFHSLQTQVEQGKYQIGIGSVKEILSSKEKYFIQERERIVTHKNNAKTYYDDEVLLKENLETKEQIELWNPQGIGCSILYFHNEILCIDRFEVPGQLSLISFPANIFTIKTLSTKVHIYGISGYTVMGNTMYIVWHDGRLRLPKFYDPRMLNIFYSNRDFGPFLVMAGELNLDTFEFREHVIRYDSEDRKCSWYEDVCPPPVPDNGDYYIEAGGSLSFFEILWGEFKEMWRGIWVTRDESGTATE